ncbi:MAG: 3-deoxy-7-phosphoheptulonate synthase [Trueperaceae bacterium]|jgi:3-deoxy-7-phosphoheptulonate synthase|nr:3-deoxy-7-phosphoheptulonate synthase [Trueperaceae bacterium]|tara:strand:+ start:4798 stop:5814 length:1017 start_codon:yes stop_codon:yes gene_type:complete
MVVVMKKQAPLESIDHVLSEIKSLGFTPHLSKGESRTVIGAIGPAPTHNVRERLRAFRDVEMVVPITQPFKLASREFRSEDSFVKIGNVKTGNGHFVVAAGPCGVESREQLEKAANIALSNGARVLRGGAFKPRTSPYSFQGLGKVGLELLAEAKESTGLPIVTEVTAPELVESVAEKADMMQVGARNTQNFALLAEVGASGKPVLFKRGISTSISEYLQAAEYILSQGNPNVVLCERGIRTFETSTRFTLDVSAVPVLKELSHLPVWVDPSHAAGKRSLVPSLALAGTAAGADGLIIEVHADPESAKSDAAQQLDNSEFHDLMERVSAIVKALGKSL